MGERCLQGDEQMARPARNRKLRVIWKRFSFTRETFDEEDALWKRCVYVISDPRGRPLYIGKATGEKYRGFGERYVGNSGPLSAIAHGSRNRLYLGRIEGEPGRGWYEAVEKELIALESRATDGLNPLYNRQFKSLLPAGLRLRQTGDVPRFYHRR
jgi:hypothetical protein